MKLTTKAMRAAGTKPTPNQNKIKKAPRKSTPVLNKNIA